MAASSHTSGLPAGKAQEIARARFGFSTSQLKPSGSWASMAAKAASSTNPESSSSAPSSPANTPRVWSPKFRVVEIVKPTKVETTSRVEVVEHDVDSQFYDDKAMGAMGRANGLKIRPDEAKRKAFSQAKRRSQRTATYINTVV